MDETEAWEDQCEHEHEQESRMPKAGKKWLSLTLTVP